MRRLAAATIAGLLLAGCGSDVTASSTSATPTASVPRCADYLAGQFRMALDTSSSYDEFEIATQAVMAEWLALPVAECKGLTEPQQEAVARTVIAEIADDVMEREVQWS